MEVPKKETPEQKAERIAQYGENSQKAYSYLVDACSSSSVALQIVINHAATDLTCWANTLMKRLTARFTIQASTRLQNLIGEFNLLTVAPEETGAMFMDRYNAKVAAISAIDLMQLPSIQDCSIKCFKDGDKICISHLVCSDDNERSRSKKH